MHAIQTLRTGGYKLALGFTALVAALVMSMGTHAYAYHTYQSGANNVGINSPDYFYVYPNTHRWCYVKATMGEVYATPFAKVQISNDYDGSGSIRCRAFAEVTSSNGSTVASGWTVSNSSGYSGEIQATGSTYYNITSARIYVEADYNNNNDCIGMLSYVRSGGSMIYQSFSPCINAGG